MNYKKINVNPFNKFTGDCSVRALAVALNKSYWVVLDELIAKQKKTGFSNEDISEDKLKSALYDFADSNHITIPDENGLDITDLDEDRGL